MPLVVVALAGTLGQEVEMNNWAVEVPDVADQKDNHLLPNNVVVPCHYDDA